jgi:hypothetical protein
MRRPRLKSLQNLRKWRGADPSRISGPLHPQRAPSRLDALLRRPSEVSSGMERRVATSLDRPGRKPASLPLLRQSRNRALAAANMSADERMPC